MKLFVRWADGIAVRYGDTRIMLDPTAANPAFEKILITHAHYDHAKGFAFLIQSKYSTTQTVDIYKADRGASVTNWNELRYGRRFEIGNLTFEAHNAGHILGSAQYEIISPEGILVYTGDINLVETLTTSAAEVAPCDILIIEATFGSPDFLHPPRDLVAVEIVRWAVQSLKDGKIPAFQTDSIGNAQELIRILNRWTQIPVVVHPRIARINKVYESYGMDLRYLESSSQEALDLANEGNCAIIAPRRFQLTNDRSFNIAYVTGWAVRMKGGDKVAFQLSDHADFHQLLEYVKEARPKKAVTCHGGRYNSIFAEYIRRKLGIDAKPLEPQAQGMGKPVASLDENRIEACQKQILANLRVPGFLYERDRIVRWGTLRGFTPAEVSEALLRLTKGGILRYIRAAGSFELRQLDATG